MTLREKRTCSVYSNISRCDIKIIISHHWFNADKNSCSHKIKSFYNLSYFLFLTDINECKSDPFPCDVNSECINTDGSFMCQCSQMFTGDGMTCTGIAFHALYFGSPSIIITIPSVSSSQIFEVSVSISVVVVVLAVLFIVVLVIFLILHKKRADKLKDLRRELRYDGWHTISLYLLRDVSFKKFLMKEEIPFPPANPKVMKPVNRGTPYQGEVPMANLNWLH